MGQARSAASSALDLMNMPSRVRLVRSEPLPEDVSLLLRLAAGDSEAERLAVEITERPVAVNRRAAAFFIEQILLSPEADSYRILGGASTTPVEELRRNMALLVRWLHPDVEPSGERSIFARRVTAAWEDLKTPERRAAYDAARQVAALHKAGVRRHGRRQSTMDETSLMAPMMAPPGLRGLWPRLMAYVFRGRRPG